MLTIRYTARTFNWICYALAFVYLWGSVEISIKLRPIESASREYHDFSQFYMGGLVAKAKAWDALYPIPHAGSINSPGEWEESDVKPAYAKLAEEAGVPAESSRYIQPPPFALALKYLAMMKYPAAKKMWRFIMALSAWSVALLAGLGYERCAGRRSRIAGGIALLIAFAPLTLETQRLMNITPFIAALIGFAIYGLLQSYAEGGALAIMEGAVAKYATVMLVPLYVAMRKWRALIVLAVCSIAVIALAWVTMGRGPFVIFLREMLPTFGRVHTDQWNRCLPAVVMHIAQAAHHADHAQPLTGALKWGVRVLQWGSLIGILALIFTRTVESWRGAKIFAGAAALLGWFLIFSPILWDHYFMYLMPVWGWLAWEARQSWIRGTMAILAVGYQCLPDFVLDHPLPVHWHGEALTLQGPYGAGMLVAALLILLVAIWRLVKPMPDVVEEKEPLTPALSPEYRGEGGYCFNSIQFNRVCSLLAGVWLLLSVPASLHHWPGDEDFPQFYMGGVMARAKAWDALYPVPKPGSLNNAGLPEDSTMRPRYAEEAAKHGVRDGTYFIQPPPVALLLEPLALVPYLTAFRLWMLLSVVCAWAVAQMAGSVYEIILGRRSMIAGGVILLIAVSPLMHHAIRVANMTVMVAALVGAAVIALARELDTTSAGAMVLGGLLKYTTAPLLPLIVILRRWKTLIWFFVFSAILCGGTLGITGAGPFRTYFTEIFPTFARTHHLETNQAISAFLMRILHRNVLPTSIRMTLLAVEGIVFLGLIALMVRVPREAWKQPHNLFAASMALLAFLLCFSPIFWEHYSVYLCPLWGYLAWEAGQSWRRMIWVIVAVALTYAPLTVWFDWPEPWNTHILPATLIMMGLGMCRIAMAKEIITAEPALFSRWRDRMMTPPALSAIARFNWICRCIAIGWLMLVVPATFKLRPPRFFDFAQFYMGGTVAKHHAWDDLYPIPHLQSVYNPGLAEDSDMRPGYAELAGRTGVGDQPRFIQPPIDALIYKPLAFLSYRKAYWVWVMLQCACGAGVVLLAGKFFAMSAGQPSRTSGIVTVVAAGSYLMYTTLRALNQEMLISLLLGLTTLEFASQVRAPAVAGLSAALGTVMKYVNVILMPIAVAARRWSVVAWYTVGLVAMIGGTLLISGRGPFKEFEHIAPLLSRPYEQEGNQSITGLALRLEGRIPPLPAGTLLGIRIAAGVTLIGLLGLIFRRKPRDWQYPPLVFAAATLLIGWTLAFSPLTWNKYFTYLTPLWGWLVWEAMQARWKMILLAVALAATFGQWEELPRLHLREPLVSHMLLGLGLIAVVAAARLLTPIAPVIQQPAGQDPTT